MRLQRSSRTATIAVLVMFSAATTTVAHAQSTDELKQRIEELERSTREQVDALKRMLQQQEAERAKERRAQDRKSTRLNSSHSQISYAVFCLKKKKKKQHRLPNTYAPVLLYTPCTSFDLASARSPHPPLPCLDLRSL